MLLACLLCVNQQGQSKKDEVGRRLLQGGLINLKHYEDATHAHYGRRRLMHGGVASGDVAAPVVSGPCFLVVVVI